MTRKYLNFNAMAPSGTVVIPGRRGPFTKRSVVNLATRHTSTKMLRIRPDIAEHKRRLALEMAWARKAAELCLSHLDGGASAAAIEREAVAYAYSSVGPLRGAK